MVHQAAVQGAGDVERQRLIQVLPKIQPQDLLLAHHEPEAEEAGEV